MYYNSSRGNEVFERTCIMAKMIIEPEKVSGIIVDFLREKVEGNDNEGIVLGLSGGVDSAVLASLAVKAVGASKVYALHLFDGYSQHRRHMEWFPSVKENIGHGRGL